MKMHTYKVEMKNLRGETSMMYLSACSREEADLLATGLANASGDKRHVVSIEIMEDACKAA